MFSILRNILSKLIGPLPASFCTGSGSEPMSQAAGVALLTSTTVGERNVVCHLKYEASLLATVGTDCIMTGHLDHCSISQHWTPGVKCCSCYFKCFSTPTAVTYFYLHLFASAVSHRQFNSFSSLLLCVSYVATLSHTYSLRADIRCFCSFYLAALIYIL